MSNNINSLPNKTIRSGDYRLAVFAQPWLDEVRISMIRYSHGKAYNVVYENGIMILREVKEGEASSDCLMRMPLDMYYEFVKLVALAETPVEEEATKAELTATKYHLEDMRELVFKKK